MRTNEFQENRGEKPSTAEFQERRSEILARLKNRALRMSKIRNGVSFVFDQNDVTFQSVMELIDLERQEFPTVIFDLRVDPQAGPIRLDVSGPEELREYIQQELKALF